MAPLSMMAPGFMEILMILVFGSGMGVPLGVPPADPDPMMAKIAPAECLYYATWAGMAEPDPHSANQTEQLLAEPEVQQFAKEVETAIRAGVTQMMGRGGDPAAAAMGQHIPDLVKTLATRPVALFVESVAPQERGLDVKGALVVNVGAELETVREAFGGVSEQIPDQAIERLEVAGVKCMRITFPPPQAPKVTVGFKDDYVIVGVGDGSFEGVLERGATPPPQWLIDGVASMKIARPSTFAYGNVEAMLKLAAGFGGPDVARMMDVLGLSAMTKGVSLSGLDETGFLSRTKIYMSDTDTGLAALMTGKPLSAEDLACIPGDASIAMAVRMDLNRVLDKGLEILRQIEPSAADDFEEGMQQVEQPLGIRIKEDLLESLGDVWTVHAAPSGGGLLAGWTVTVDLRDKKGVENAHKKVLQFANLMLNQQPRAPQIRTAQFKGHTTYMLDVPEREFFLAPSWCVTDTHLVITLLPQALKSFLSRDGSAPSLADQADVAKLLTADDGPCAISYQDSRSQFVTFYPFLQYAAVMVSKQLQREGIQVNPGALPSITAIAPHLLPTVSAARKTDDGFEFMMHNTMPGASTGASAPVLVALLLPAVQAAREAARRAQTSNNLKQIALAMHNYHDVFKAFPAAYSVDEDGKPLLSWRVHILPFIEGQALYDEFHLDEPWDSAHNRKLIARMPAGYRSPNSVADPGKTVYLGNAGERGIMVPPKDRNKGPKMPQGTRMRDIRDGTSNTIMAVEAADPVAVIWTKPDDYVFDEDHPIRGLEGMRPGIFMAALCDGSVRALATTIDVKVLKALFTRDGGEAVDFDP